jgi:hypothetical protein
MKYEPGHWSRANPHLGLSDLIIASDLLYDRGQPEALSQFINRHSAPAAHRRFGSAACKSVGVLV